LFFFVRTDDAFLTGELAAEFTAVTAVVLLIKFCLTAAARVDMLLYYIVILKNENRCEKKKSDKSEKEREKKVESHCAFSAQKPFFFFFLSSFFEPITTWVKMVGDIDQSDLVLNV
jgi:hypothetical protein